MLDLSCLPACPETYGVRGAFECEGIPVVDCRAPDAVDPYDNAIDSPDGFRMYASERAAYWLGLRPGYQDATPIRGSGYCRLTDDSIDLPRALARAVEAFRDAQAAFNASPAGPCKGDHGGSWNVKPLCITLSNYGWAVLADRRVYRVKPF